VVVTEEMLTRAVRDGDLGTLTIWAKQGVRVTTGQPLFSVVVHGDRQDFKTMQFLVREMGADVNRFGLLHPSRPKSDSYTPLYIASSQGRQAVARCLIELGANVNQAMADGGRSLHAAVYSGGLAVVRCLIEFGADIGAVNNEGNTALVAGAWYGRYSILRWMLEHGGTSMEEMDEGDDTAWYLLELHLKKVKREYT
jgi:ankyrin repeat protein